LTLAAHGEEQHGVAELGKEVFAVLDRRVGVPLISVPKVPVLSVGNSSA
jgi:hypothetical protein